ncbi:MAG: hypothetical protein IPN19_12385 [Elusimicrobia bacterium]|nr:hypothetical protein [Elusimicrobiota bacterium]
MSNIDGLIWRRLGRLDAAAGIWVGKEGSGQFNTKKNTISAPRRRPRGFRWCPVGGVGGHHQAAPHNPPADSHGVCGWPWGEGGRFAWSAASGAVRAEVRPARRRNGAALAVATVEHGFL